MTLACKDANSKLVEVVTITNVDHEDRVGNSLLHTWELGSVVPLAMFSFNPLFEEISISHDLPIFNHPFTATWPG